VAQQKRRTTQQLPRCVARSLPRVHVDLLLSGAFVGVRIRGPREIADVPDVDDTFATAAMREQAGEKDGGEDQDPRRPPPHAEDCPGTKSGELH
jgi:hypothetical protein